MDAPERFYNVSISQLSIAKYYGGIMFNSHYYIYCPITDTLTRSDVLQAEQREKRLTEKCELKKLKDNQASLF